MSIAVVRLPPVLLVLAACGGEGSPAPSPAAVTSPAADPDPLRADGVRAGRWIGAAIQSRLLSEPAYTRTLGRHFDYVTAEWEMKWDPTERQPGVFSFEGAIRGSTPSSDRTIPCSSTTPTWRSPPSSACRTRCAGGDAGRD